MKSVILLGLQSRALRLVSEQRWLVLTIFVRQIDAEEYRTALAATDALLKELKQLDDKIILTEVYLLESRAAHSVSNLIRAKVRHGPSLYSVLELCGVGGCPQ